MYPQKGLTTILIIPIIIIIMSISKIPRSYFRLKRKMGFWKNKVLMILVKMEEEKEEEVSLMCLIRRLLVNNNNNNKKDPLISRVI
ncbi:hypothetical protein F8388_026614 [Cannabis sativa]|uniref:Uncharacterized protein n=1 Tax=Cannabis sativa TaxID=3483 RepID=A0A7J6EAM6_CANSA|nr:hypothetical protein F8388_026614 [Cannabis sativa]